MNGLSFLQPQCVGNALKYWRESKKKTRQDITDASKVGGKRGFAIQEVGKFENGVGFSYQRLVEKILPAYGIVDVGDFDLFVDHCKGHSIDDVVFVMDTSRIIHENHESEEILINPEDLKSNRSRISVIKIRTSTKWQQHEGHEFVLVSKGRVRAEFSVEQDGRRTTQELKAGQGVAFPCALFHSFTNIDSVESEITIARPTKSLPKGIGED